MGGGRIVKGNDDDALCTGQQQRGVEALVHMVGQIAHSGMRALRQPLAVTVGSGLIDRPRLGKATGREANLGGLLLDEMG